MPLGITVRDAWPASLALCVAIDSAGIERDCCSQNTSAICARIFCRRPRCPLLVKSLIFSLGVPFGWNQIQAQTRAGPLDAPTMPMPLGKAQCCPSILATVRGRLPKASPCFLEIAKLYRWL